jgi:putative hemolysin
LDDPGSYPLVITLLIKLNELSSPQVIISITGMVLLLICAAFISAAEVALFSLEPSHLDIIRKSKSKSDDIILNLIKDTKRLIATLLISINFANIGIVLFSSIILKKLFAFESQLYAFLFQVIVVTFLLLIAGEVVPKIYASRNALKVAAIMAYPISILRKIFYPISSFMMFSTKLIDKNVKTPSNQISVEDLEQALELTSGPGKEYDNEHRILKGIVRFGNTTVKQAMTPRVDVFALDKEWGFKKVVQTILDSGFSRLPVYEENFDNITGILVIKDLLKHIEEEDSFKWWELCRPAQYVPETKKIDDLLKEFQTKKTHMAVVVDEYGGSYGIITLEDILEEILGDINDEFDEDELKYSKLDEFNFVFEGKIPLNDLFKIISIEEKEIEEARGEAETLAGFIIEHKGRIPKKGEKLSFGNLLFLVEAADKRKIKRVKVTIVNQPTEINA